MVFDYNNILIIYARTINKKFIVNKVLEVILQ